MMKFTNSWQHLIMSIFTMVVGLYLYLHNTPGVGVGLISLVATTWFVPGVIKQVAGQITEELEKWVLETYGRRPQHNKTSRALDALHDRIHDEE